MRFKYTTHILGNVHTVYVNRFPKKRRNSQTQVCGQIVEGDRRVHIYI